MDDGVDMVDWSDDAVSEKSVIGSCMLVVVSGGVLGMIIGILVGLVFLVASLCCR
jgi:uncharacterized membrane protein